ncbi:zinc ribbon domain-containing protein [Candidatus Dependentiae bacterium]
MIKNSLWKNLKSLVNIDQQIKTVDYELKRIEKILQNNKINIPKLEEQLKQEEYTFSNEKKNITKQEILAKEFREQEEKEKKLLEKITNPKEYKAFEKELKSITQKIIAQDDILVRAWHQLESAEKNFNQKKEDVFEKISLLKEGIIHQNESFKDHSNRKETLLISRQETLKLIPKAWVDKYERMILKVSDPIVPVLGECCSSCYYEILRQDLAVLRKSNVLPCRNCYRFLYCEEQEKIQIQDNK